jgi:hypothetical protein
VATRSSRSARNACQIVQDEWLGGLLKSDPRGVGRKCGHCARDRAAGPHWPAVLGRRVDRISLRATLTIDARLSRNLVPTGDFVGFETNSRRTLLGRRLTAKEIALAESHSRRDSGAGVPPVLRPDCLAGQLTGRFNFHSGQFPCRRELMSSHNILKSGEFFAPVPSAADVPLMNPRPV